MIQVLLKSGKRLALNMQRLASYEEMTCVDGSSFTYIVIDGGGGAYIASHNIAMTYDQFSSLVSDFYAETQEEKGDNDDLCIDMYNPALSNWRECMITVHRRNFKEMEELGWERYWAWQDDG